MSGSAISPVLADAADVLSDQLRVHLGRLAAMVRPHSDAIERRFVVRLKQMRLNVKERTALAGSFIALQIYTPEETPRRRIEAFGASAQDCIAMLRRRGLDPLKFEFIPLKPPY